MWNISNCSTSNPIYDIVGNFNICLFCKCVIESIWIICISLITHEIEKTYHFFIEQHLRSLSFFLMSSLFFSYWFLIKLNWPVSYVFVCVCVSCELKLVFTFLNGYILYGCMRACIILKHGIWSQNMKYLLLCSVK